MKRSILILAAAAVAAMSAFSDAVGRATVAVHALADRLVGLWRKATDFAVAVLAGPVPMRQQAELVAARQLLVSQATTLRQAKRERPRITGIWRMCPST